MIKKIKWKPVNIFFLISFIGIFSYFIYAYFNGHTAMLWLAQENNTKIRFLDYFMHIEIAAKNGNIYDGLADIVGCFPPLAYIMYRFLFRITAYPEMECRGWKEFAGVEGAEIVFLYYSMFVAALFLIAIIITGRNDMKKSVALFFCLMLSVSFFGSGYAMGNSTMLVLAMLVFALHLKDTDSRVGKETGLILIALSAGLKIYPAIFGLLYLKEKRYKEAARLVVYGLLCGFLPFVFFGGLDAVVSWIEHIKGTMGLLETGKNSVYKRCSIFSAGKNNRTGKPCSHYVFIKCRTVDIYYSDDHTCLV